MKISNASDFSEFAENVSSGISYSGTTVLLDSDLSLSDETFEPIDYYFCGVFDGQGYVVSDLELNTYLQYTGLFGFLTGLTIRNVVLDSSCSITNAYSGSNDLYVGGIIGYCYANNGHCTIENSVNMAGITFSGDISSNSLYVGGIAGELYRPSSGSNYPIYVKNCANYGSVAHSGTSEHSYIGGIVGCLPGSSSYKYVYNSLNYGKITHKGTSTNPIIGGIVGYAESAYIENCVSAGKISTRATAPESNSIGSIVGYIYSSRVHINYCYYTSDVGVSSLNGYGTPKGTTGTPDIPTDANLELVSKLNNNATSCNWNKWLINANNATVTFKVDNKEFSFSSQIILIPDPVKEGNSFLFWCKDAERTEEFDSDSVSGNTTLYAAWVNNTVTFNVNGGDELSDSETTKTVTFGESYGVLPKSNRMGYTFAGWFNEDENVTSEATVKTPKNHTLHAKWTPNNYTVTFNVNGGDELSDSETTKTVTFGENYGCLPEPNRTGYTFAGWLNEGNEIVKSETTVKIPQNHTLHANWTTGTYTVALDADGGGGIPASMFVVFDSAYGELPTPNRTGYAFAGWFTETPGGDPVNSSTIVTTPYDHTIYAHWSAIQYTISFDPRGGGACRNITQDYNTLLTLPEPERAGYTFVGWFGAGLATEYTVKTVQAENVTLHAKWEANTYVVAFDVNGGNEPVNPKSVAFDSAYGELPEPSRTGHTFAGWADSPLNGNEVSSTTTVHIPNNHTLYALWTANKYAIAFDLGGGKVMATIQSYGDVVIYPSEVPSKSFHKFRRWCTKGVGANSERCNVTHVPASNLTLAASFDVDSSLVAGSSVAVVAVVLFIVLLVVFIVYMKASKKAGRNYEPIGVELNEDNEKTANRANERTEKRISQQVKTVKISNSFAKTLKNSLRKAKKNKGLDEILADLGVEREDDDSDDVIESFRTNGGVQTSIASAVRKKENFVAVAEYLRLLYTTVREQEEYEEFDELYFGMKNIGNFMDKMDEKTISFGGVVSGFTSKRKAIHFLMPRDEKSKDGNDMPSGVLFKVKNGRGYRIGKVDEETDEVLFEINSVFKVESVREVTRDKFLVVALSFISPEREDELIKL